MEFISQAHLSFPQTKVLGVFSSSGHGVFSGEVKKRQGTYREDTQIEYYWLVDSLYFLTKVPIAQFIAQPHRKPLWPTDQSFRGSGKAFIGSRELQNLVEPCAQ